jgi:hypothetical protein
MPTNNKRRDQAAFNAFCESYVRFQVWIDGCLGVTPTPDREPYVSFRRPAVAALLKRIDHDDPMAQPSATKRARRGRSPSAPPTTLQVPTVRGEFDDPLPDWL